MKVTIQECSAEEEEEVRVSKSVIVNLSKVDHFSPMFQGRMDACMTNKEHVVISRQYVSLLKVRLGLKN